MRRTGIRADDGKQTVHSPAVPGYRLRHDGWTDARRKIFLTALSQTGCVRDACARAGMSNTSAYRLRARHQGFARAWERALKQAMPTIQQAAYERAVLGWDEPIVYAGKIVGVRRRYSDALLRLLLARQHHEPEPGSREAIALAHAAAKLAGGVFSTRSTREETNRALAIKLDALDARLKREAAEQVARRT